MHMSDHLKQQIKGKMQERDRLEATILECSTRLEAAGVGLYDKLVDQEVARTAGLLRQFLTLYLAKMLSNRMKICRAFPVQT